MKNIEISLMQESDLDDIYEIERKVYSHPWSINVFRGELSRPDRRIYLVARVNDKIAGYAGLMVVNGEGHITNLAVDVKYRKKRLGTLLAIRIIEMAILKRIHWLTLEVRASNIAAQNLYEKLGFQIIGERKGYYSDGENALIMWTNDIIGDEYTSMIKMMKKELMNRPL